MQRNKAVYAHTKLNAAKEMSEHAEGSAAWESECSKRARTPQAVGSAAWAGVELRRCDFKREEP